MKPAYLFVAAFGIAVGFAIVKLWPSSRVPIREKACYVASVRGKKFHKLDCRVLPQSESRVFFTSRQEAAASEYTPCGLCQP